ncbi:FtsW/RodA/SpoVE family cell cycle protein [Schaalia naturae]|uniref:Probable peptidoglycan glycosyltransferase FtsW n=1 Tax=Schaalia naturae TaxID=635203 RepID=A0ABW2SLS9_9ACTO
MSGLRRRPRLPRVEFGTAHPAAASPVATFYLIVIPALILCGFGLLMAFSASAVTNIAAGASPYEAFLRPLLIIVVSLACAAVVQLVPERIWSRGAPWVFLAALIIQCLVVTPLGATEGGNRNWIHIPGVPTLLQPSEFLKLALALFLAASLARPGARLRDWRQMAATAGLPVLAALGAVMLGHDLGTALVVFACALGALWVAGLPGGWFAVLGGASVPALAFFIVQNPTRLQRVIDVLPGHGASRSTTAPEQIDHALWALGSGGLLGLGPGASREKWEYLQAAHTDFVLAIIGEEFGLLGTLTVLVCLGLLVWGMIRVCRESTSGFARVTSGGVAAWIGAQALLNIMSVTGIGPVIGVPLPLVSYGGSSFLFTACAVGIVASFARADAGMRMIGSPAEGPAGRDPRRPPRRRSPGRPGAHRAAPATPKEARP